MKAKKSAASFRPERLTRRSEAAIQKYSKSAAARETSNVLRARGLEPTAADLTEMPQLTGAELNALYRPLKTPVTVRLDADILAWLKAKGGKYQTQMNSLLRGAMIRERR